MAKFLDTTGVSYHLQQMINQAEEKIYLISPFLQINRRVKQSLEDKYKYSLDIRIVYGKSDLQPEESDWLKEHTGIRTSFCKNLHAKCYLSEKEVILTSMNLYEFSEVNNIEMGIHLSKESDKSLYNDVYKEVMRIIRSGEEVQISVSKVSKEKLVKPEQTSRKLKKQETSGFCIVCNALIPLNPLQPYCKDCYSVWKSHGNAENKEDYCHVCGEKHQATLLKPACYKCYKKNRNILSFPEV